MSGTTLDLRGRTTPPGTRPLGTDVDPQVERILFTDSVLLKRIADSNFAWKGKVQDGGAEHRNHFHVDVKP
jgi:hypothetical protein